MQNEEAISNRFIDCVDDESNNSSQHFLIVGESGIGKSFLLQSIKEQLWERVCLINISGSRTPGKSNLSCFYDGIYNSLQNANLEYEKSFEIIKKFATLLPGFGKHISGFLSMRDFDALGKIGERTGFRFDSHAAPRAVQFVEAISESRAVVLLVDDIQWIDPGTWEFVSFVLSNYETNNWHSLITLNDSVVPHADIMDIQESLLGYFNQNSKTFIQLLPERWSQNKIDSLIARISSVEECLLDEKQKNVIHTLTNGIPKFVEEVVYSLVEEDYLVHARNSLISKGNWSSFNTPKALQEILKRHLDKLFLKIEKSREALEIASVVGETFVDDTIGKILNIDEIYHLLKKIESHSKVIEDLFHEHRWKFRHSLNHKVLYEAIGSKVHELHKKVAEYMVENFPEEYETISYHYKHAEILELALLYQLKSCKTLIESALFRSTIQKVARIENDAESLTFNDELIREARILKGQALFHLNRFSEAIKVFSMPIFKHTESEAECKRWLARSYVSLCSQLDFQEAVKNFLDAIDLYSIKNDKKALAETYSELSVAYEHCNEYNQTESSYKQSELLFKEIRDEKGINRLWRRSGMVLDGKLGSRILTQTANRFKQWGMPHEQLMALNNGAVAYLYCGEDEKFKELIDNAIELSMDISEFGMDHLLCNLCIYYLLVQDYQQASEVIEQARSYKDRDVTSLVTEIAGSAVAIHILPLEAALLETQITYDRCLVEGEISYIIPALINYSQVLERKGDISLAISLLEKITPFKTSTKRYYLHCQQSKWYQRLGMLYKKNSQMKKERELAEKYSWCLPPESVKFYGCGFGAVPNQFCSP